MAICVSFLIQSSIMVMPPLTSFTPINLALTLHDRHSCIVSAEIKKKVNVEQSSAPW